MRKRCCWGPLVAFDNADRGGYAVWRIEVVVLSVDAPRDLHGTIPEHWFKHNRTYIPQNKSHTVWLVD